MPTLTLTPELTLHYTLSTPLQATKPPLILLHGAGGNRLHWPPALRHSQTIPVIAIDLPAHGQSAGSVLTTLAEYAAVLHQFITHLDLPQVLLAGHSMGGGIALQYAINHPQRVAGLAMVSSAARLKVGAVLLAHLAAGEHTAAAELMTNASYGPNAPEPLLRLGRQRLLDVPLAVLAADLNACHQFDLRDQIYAWQGPTCLLVGEVDQMTPARFNQSLAEQWPQAQLTILPKVGHMLPLEQPDLTTEILLNFCQQLYSA